MIRSCRQMPLSSNMCPIRRIMEQYVCQSVRNDRRNAGSAMNWSTRELQRRLKNWAFGSSQILSILRPLLQRDEKMSSEFQTGMAANGLTAALIGLVTRLLKRSKCHSNSACCEIDIERAEREKTERDHKLVEVVIAQLRAEAAREGEQGQI